MDLNRNFHRNNLNRKSILNKYKIENYKTYKKIQKNAKTYKNIITYIKNILKYFKIRN